MPRYPGAVWRPVAGHTDGPMRSHTGVVLHVNESDGNLWNWVAGNHDMSCHFEVYKSGVVEQYLDTSMTSWCQAAGNADYLSIETEGYATEPFTDAQLHAIAALLAWLTRAHSIPLQLAERPGEAGCGWHGMGGDAWGGHPGCPGPARRDARMRILALAGVHPSPAPTPPAPKDGFLMALTDQQQAELYNDVRRLSFAWDPGTQIPWQKRGELNTLLHTTAAGTSLLNAQHGEPVDVQATATALAGALGPKLGAELVAALGAALSATTPGA